MDPIAFRKIGLVCLLLLSARTPMTGTCDEGDPLRADVVWLTPVRIVHTSGPAFGSSPQEAGYDSTYGAAKLLDNDLASFCCLLDDTPGRVEDHPESIPVGGVAPVTGRIRFDLGRALRIVGIRLVAPSGWWCLCAEGTGRCLPRGKLCLPGNCACLAGNEAAEGAVEAVGPGDGDWVLPVRNHAVPRLTGRTCDVAFPATLVRL